MRKVTNVSPLHARLSYIFLFKDRFLGIGLFVHVFKIPLVRFL